MLIKKENKIVENKCLSCLSLTEINKINSDRTILKTTYWTLKHKDQSPLLGWVVLILNRHCTSLDKLNDEEWFEFSILLKEIINLLKLEFNPDKEYVCQFSEKIGFEHIHWHIIPIKNLLTEYKGPKIFELAKNKKSFLSNDEIIYISKKLQVALASIMEKFIF